VEISEQTVLNVARLANLSLTSEELRLYQLHLGKIIGFIDQLQSVKLGESSSIEITDTPERSDTCKPSLSEAEVVQNAALSTGSSFTVPRIIESN
jgi:aspartyl/glutamyl-tRNA(Asn/Gln) amidotransferase C subunit